MTVWSSISEQCRICPSHVNNVYAKPFHMPSPREVTLCTPLVGCWYRRPHHRAAIAWQCSPTATTASRAGSDAPEGRSPPAVCAVPRPGDRLRHAAHDRRLPRLRPTAAIRSGWSSREEDLFLPSVLCDSLFAHILVSSSIFELVWRSGMFPSSRSLGDRQSSLRFLEFLALFFRPLLRI